MTIYLINLGLGITVMKFIKVDPHICKGSFHEKNEPTFK